MVRKKGGSCLFTQAKPHTCMYSLQQGETGRGFTAFDTVYAYCTYHQPVITHHNLVTININTVCQVSSQRNDLDLITTTTVILRRQISQKELKDIRRSIYVHAYLHKLTSTNVIMSQLMFKTFSH